MSTYRHAVCDFTGHEVEFITFNVSTGEILTIDLWAETACTYFDATNSIRQSDFSWKKYEHLVRLVRHDLLNPTVKLIGGAS